MFQIAKSKVDAMKSTAQDWKSFMVGLNKPGIVETPWCKQNSCEEKVKERSGVESKMDEEASLTGSAKTLCIPLNQKEVEGLNCFHCGEKA